MKRIKISCIPLITAIILLPVSFPEIYLGEVEIKIKRGKNLSDIANLLAESRIIEDRYGFRVLGTLSRKSSMLSYGWYELELYQNPRLVINMLSKGQRMTIRITIPEGLTMDGTLNLLAKKSDINIEKMDSLIKDKDFIISLGLNVNSLEGYLFPDTYIFYKSEDPEKVIRKMVYNLSSILKPGFWIRINSMRFDSKEILTIASLIEKEAMVDREKPIIASVIYNRLKKGMKLQIDATVLYALGYSKGRVYFKDLKVNSPYNTYIHKGLPPGPIANPGYQSILAATHPGRTDYFYYVATGKGDHIFTKTFKEHKTAKFKIRRNR